LISDINPPLLERMGAPTIANSDGQKIGRIMLTVFRILDAEAHEPGCLQADIGVPCPDPNLTYLDIFCECHRYTEPKILGSGIDIAWPAGWTQEQADAWRSERGLTPPCNITLDSGERSSR